MLMSSTYSWMLRNSCTLLAFSTLLQIVGTPAFAEEATVLIRPDAGNVDFREFLTHDRVAGIISQLGSDLPFFMPSVQDCSTLLAIPFGHEPGRSPKTDTRTIIMSQRTRCWAFTQVPATAHVAPATAQDGISPAMIETLMTYLR